MQTIKPKTIEMNPSSKTMLDAILVFCVITGFIVIALEIFAMIFIVVFCFCFCPNFLQPILLSCELWDLEMMEEKEERARRLR
ncbi:hypothetical protein Q9233_009656 [Columba guinea]|nr:hypothetical protein Q9233_009656 [Columba guinea]